MSSSDPEITLVDEQLPEGSFEHEGIIYTNIKKSKEKISEFLESNNFFTDFVDKINDATIKNRYTINIKNKEPKINSLNINLFKIYTKLFPVKKFQKKECLICYRNNTEVVFMNNMYNSRNNICIEKHMKHICFGCICRMTSFTFPDTTSSTFLCPLCRTKTNFLEKVYKNFS